MCKARTPKVERSAPPPMQVPEQADEQVQRKSRRARERNAAAFGRESTVLGGPAVQPTAQAKTLLGS